MPLFAVLDDQVISVPDMYKHSIPTTSQLSCFNCEKRLLFKQQRNADKDFTEHFYHPNTKKGTHIECENTSFMKPQDDRWHVMMSSLVDRRCREVVRKRKYDDEDADDNNNSEQTNVKHIVDAYNRERHVGVEFQNSPISADAVRSRDATTHLDWIFNVERQCIRKVRVGNFGVCEVPYDKWTSAIRAVKNHVFLYTGCAEWILLTDRNVYYVEIPESKRRHVWIGELVPFEKVWTTCLQHVLTDEGAESLRTTTARKALRSVDVVYARCKASMCLLDSIHRQYIYDHAFENGKVVALKSVAGSGKTTTLLKLAKVRSTHRILYLAFNKSLQTEVEAKAKNQNIPNLHPRTFDSLVLELCCEVHCARINISDVHRHGVTPQNICNILPWFRGVSFPSRKRFVKLFKDFCGQYEHSSPQAFCRALQQQQVSQNEWTQLEMLWHKCVAFDVVTFDSMRKMSQLNHWFRRLSRKYDMIFVDEVQDFDRQMLHMVLHDTTMPKLFVGDPRQSIYSWRPGHVNAFEHLPHDALVIEFYSTFRVGEPACEQIRNMFDDCWMVSRSTNETVLSTDTSLLDDKTHTYLFRTWRHLLLTATTTPRVWIHSYEVLIEKMRKQRHYYKQREFDADSYDEDLPRFLKELNEKEFESLLSKIHTNIVPRDECMCKMYTIHAFKGLEDEYIRIHEDVYMQDNDQLNLYYVSLTRGTKLVVEALRRVPHSGGVHVKDVLQVSRAVWPVH